MTERAREIAHDWQQRANRYGCRLRTNSEHSDECDWLTERIATALSRAKAEGAEEMHKRAVAYVYSGDYWPEAPPSDGWNIARRIAEGLRALPTPKDDHGR